MRCALSSDELSRAHALINAAIDSGAAAELTALYEKLLRARSATSLAVRPPAQPSSTPNEWRAGNRLPAQGTLDLGSEVVSALAVLVDVEPFPLSFSGWPKTDRFIDDQEQDQ